MSTAPCRASWASSRAYENTRRAMVTDAIACPECGKPVRLKLMGASKTGRYVGIPKHTGPPWQPVRHS